MSNTDSIATIISELDEAALWAAEARKILKSREAQVASIVEKLARVIDGSPELATRLLTMDPLSIANGEKLLTVVKLPNGIHDISLIEAEPRTTMDDLMKILAGE